MANKPLCQKKQFENPVKPTFTIPQRRPDLTITKIVTPPRVNENDHVTSPKKIVYPPLGPDEDILEIDLHISDSENSESETETTNTPSNIFNTVSAQTKQNDQHTSVEQPKKLYHSTGKCRLDPAIFEQTNRPAPRKLSQSIKRPNPFVWSRVDPPSKRAPSTNFALCNTELIRSTPPATIIINNYYRGIPYNPPHKPVPQCTDPARMSRGQFKRFISRKSTTQAQIKEALAIRNSLKNI